MIVPENLNIPFHRKHCPPTSTNTTSPPVTNSSVTSSSQSTPTTTTTTTVASTSSAVPAPAPSLEADGEVLPKYRRDLVAKQKILRAELTALQPQSGHCRLEVSRSEIFEVCIIIQVNLFGNVW